jgi:hypothetical protein
MTPWQIFFFKKIAKQLIEAEINTNVTIRDVNLICNGDLYGGLPRLGIKKLGIFSMEMEVREKVRLGGGLGKKIKFYSSARRDGSEILISGVKIIS